ncbi:MAG: hypothetical protein ACK5N4_23480 [Parabacteroides gordonii]|uniref:hypothetical protein n=1 Tax=Parabacteroides gordonii TaxID=574930 RepID=UPI003A8A7244
MKNIDILKDFVNTQYNDMQGVISIDDHGINPSFLGLCKAHGIDTKKYFLLGFGISVYNIIAPTSENASVTCKVLLLEKEKYGSNFDEIEANVRSEETTDVVEKTFSVTYKELGEYIKRLDFMAVTDMSKNISKMNIME